MKYFICDDAPASFFTAVFDAYKETDCVITSDSEIQLTLGCETVRVHYDGEKCDRVRRGIARYDGFAEQDIIIALRSGDKKKEQICLGYIRRIFAQKRTVKNAYNMPEVADFNNLMHRVTLEVHHLHGFLRFKETADGAFYAPYSPDNDITDMLMPHFAARFKAERFVIHDIKRGVAGLYNGESWATVQVGAAEVCLSEAERSFEQLWKKYYKSVNIESRPHEKQMKGSMPVRYWKFLPEKQ